MPSRGIFTPRRGFRNRVKSHKKPFKLFLILFLSILAFLIFSTFKTGFLEIKNVEVDSTGINCATSEQLLNESALKGQNFFVLNGEEIGNRVKKKFICIKDVLVDVYFLRKVKIKFIARNPVFVLSLVESKENKKIPNFMGAPQIEGSASAALKYIEATSAASLDFSTPKVNLSFLMDDEGVLFAEKSAEVTLPVIYYDQSRSNRDQKIILGQSLEKEKVKNVIKIFEKIKEFGLNPIDGKIYSDSQLIINTEPKLIFELNRNINTQLASLQVILEEAKINDKDMEYVDLRFDNPVVRYLPKEKTNGTR